jgi:hypothetical protein
MNKNILHLVLGSKENHYKMIENVAKKTWMKNSPENIKTIFMYGGENKIFWDNFDSFYVDRPESHAYFICLYKTIKAFEWFYQSDFDYIYRTNCTGYFDLNLVSEYLSDKPTENYYSGYIVKHDEVEFASGASFFLSKDIVKKIIDNQDILFSYGYPGWMDDVAIGKFINNHLGIKVDKHMTDNELRRIVTPENIDDNLDMGQFHYYVEPRNSNLENVTAGYIDILNKIHTLKTR